jgi:hypothetical protein
VVLRGDPDPNKSDLVLQAAIDPATERISNHGNLGDVFLNTFVDTAKALAQAMGRISYHRLTIPTLFLRKPPI